ncbi:hypothetical protein HYDPIDRAFT_93231 [Hydnomerulius pinastri MD-312]|uniref:F-box domain-containing protein n=1 Tax=Hydnomerulius pinastri MD-312 TaxID=994086 RepID=A0A0C9WE39_9AGAM|nr:hypothetical protein HYDPIDRAFT_93231 [Hydnomerulius pinastri MD-312]
MSSFPSELWMHVFEELDSPRDLAAVVRTNKRFQALGERVLYRNVIWTNPRTFVKNYHFLADNPALHTVPRSLTLGISQMYNHIDRIEQINRARGVIQPTGETTTIPRSSRSSDVRVLEEVGIVSPIEFLASEHLAEIIYNQSARFINLKELNFVGMVLPDTFYSFVHHFPALEKLRIEDCTPPIRPVPTSLHPKDLPITELTILGLRGRRDLRELRSFAEGQQLRIIRFDWTCYIYKHFCEPPNPVPSPHIHTIDAKFPTQKSWQSHISEPHDQLINPFVEFLGKCPRVTNLRIRNHLPWLRLPQSALRNLTFYQGPLTTVGSVVSGSRPIKRLDIKDASGSLAALEKAFRDIDAGGVGEGLEGLSIYLGWWDDEILYATLHHFKKLKSLELMYKEGDPTEETVLGMGAHFFGEMRDLASVRVFKVAPAGWDDVGSLADRLSARGYPHRSIQLALGELVVADTPFARDADDESDFDQANYAGGPSSASACRFEAEPEEMTLKELINAWNRYCPALREVQLQAGYVWRRAGEGDEWAQRKVEVRPVAPRRGAAVRLSGEGWFEGA